jgi:mxaJ protein
MARYRRPAGAAALFVLVALGLASARADEPRTAFRPCIDPNNLPFSNSAGDGFENRIAKLFAQQMGLPVRSYEFPQRMNFVRNTLRYRLPGTDFRCDILMGVPAGYDQAWTTAAYYRSTYVLVFPKGRGLDEVKTGNDLFTVFDASSRRPVIGVYDRSPASIWLVKHGWEEQARPYRMLSADPEQYPGEIIAKDLAQGVIDAAIVWGPIGGYFAKRMGEGLRVVPLRSEPGVKFDYEMAMGVRYGDSEWKAAIERLIVENRAAITAILREYDVPLVDEHGDLLGAAMPDAASQVARFLPVSASVVRVEAQREKGGLSVGSGVTVAPSVIATNCHVIRDATRVRISGAGASWHVDAQIADMRRDLCFLRVPSWLGEPVKLAPSDAVSAGAAVVALGFSGGGAIAPHFGHVRGLRALGESRIIESDAAFNSGSSGGGLFDESGALIGLLTFRSRNWPASFYSLPVAWIREGLPREPRWARVEPLKGTQPFWQDEGGESAALGRR